jgi:hypothetical protein
MYQIYNPSNIQFELKNTNTLSLGGTPFSFNNIYTLYQKIKIFNTSHTDYVIFRTNLARATSKDKRLYIFPTPKMFELPYWIKKRENSGV